MDEDAAVSLALSAAQDLKGVASDVGEIKEALRDYVQRQPVEVPLPDDAEDSGSADQCEAVPLVAEAPALPEDFSSDLMGFQWMQTVLLCFLLVAMLLNVGATLWLAFSDKWRS